MAEVVIVDVAQDRSHQVRQDVQVSDQYGYSRYMWMHRYLDVRLLGVNVIILTLSLVMDTVV